MELTGEERAVYTIVKQYDKREPISRGELVSKVRRLGFDLPERIVRKYIESLRLKEYLICSFGGTNGGYYMATDLAEYEEFDQKEYGARIMSMLETRAAMRRGAKRQFGQVYQQSMFGGF